MRRLARRGGSSRGRDPAASAAAAGGAADVGTSSASSDPAPSLAAARPPVPKNAQVEAALHNFALLRLSSELSLANSTDEVADAYVRCVRGVIPGGVRPALFVSDGVDGTGLLRACGRTARRRGMVAIQHGQLSQAITQGGAIVLPDTADGAGPLYWAVLGVG